MGERERERERERGRWGVIIRIRVKGPSAHLGEGLHVGAYM